MLLVNVEKYSSNKCNMRVIFRTYLNKEGTHMEVSKLIKELYTTTDIKPFINSLIILAVSFLLLKLVMFLTEKIIKITNFNEQKEKTVKSIVDSLAAYFILSLAILNILSEFGIIQKSTILTSAGIITVIAGLGAQNLIKDVINGFFILFEKQMTIGDVVNINDLYIGTVEDIGLRTTAIRDFYLKKIYIPNGEIKTLKNYYKEQARVILKIVVPFEENQEKVSNLLKDACTYLNETYDDKLYKVGNIAYCEFHLYGIVSLDGTIGGAKYLVMGVVHAEEQWSMRNRSYEHILKVFNDNGVRIAYPRLYSYDKTNI
ncbi:hypothetical protein CCE28_14265 [Anaeromicrobium sediminis]|uniref:Mechanosensitive ion channel MscS domain-containing protein n=2 Tax=Anaeromicrobium sediminis TaxID=1478221 RepID=A0A267MIM1_9FIRM|nr:hypothetical protein CCE28_14265 [Anaeromicrobium sediminis]